FHDVLSHKLLPWSPVIGASFCVQRRHVEFLLPLCLALLTLPDGGQEDLRGRRLDEAQQESFLLGEWRGRGERVWPGLRRLRRHGCRPSVVRTPWRRAKRLRGRRAWRASGD